MTDQHCSTSCFDNYHPSTGFLKNLAVVVPELDTEVIAAANGVCMTDTACSPGCAGTSRCSHMEMSNLNAHGNWERSAISYEPSVSELHEGGEDSRAIVEQRLDELIRDVGARVKLEEDYANDSTVSYDGSLHPFSLEVVGSESSHHLQSVLLRTVSDAPFPCGRTSMYDFDMACSTSYDTGSGATGCSSMDYKDFNSHVKNNGIAHVDYLEASRASEACCDLEPLDSTMSYESDGDFSTIEDDAYATLEMLMYKVLLAVYDDTVGAVGISVDGVEVCHLMDDLCNVVCDDLLDNSGLGADDSLTNEYIYRRLLRESNISVSLAEGGMQLMHRNQGGWEKEKDQVMSREQIPVLASQQISGPALVRLYELAAAQLDQGDEAILTDASSERINCTLCATLDVPDSSPWKIHAKKTCHIEKQILSNFMRTIRYYTEEQRITDRIQWDVDCLDPPPMGVDRLWIFLEKCRGADAAEEEAKRLCWICEVCLAHGTEVNSFEVISHLWHLGHQINYVNMYHPNLNWPREDSHALAKALNQWWANQTPRRKSLRTAVVTQDVSQMPSGLAKLFIPPSGAQQVDQSSTTLRGEQKINKSAVPSNVAKNPLVVLPLAGKKKKNKKKKKEEISEDIVTELKSQIEVGSTSTKQPQKDQPPASTVSATSVNTVLTTSTNVWLDATTDTVPTYDKVLTNTPVAPVKRTSLLDKCAEFYYLSRKKKMDLLWCEDCWRVIVVEHEKSTVDKSWSQHVGSEIHKIKKIARDALKFDSSCFVGDDTSLTENLCRPLRTRQMFGIGNIVSRRWLSGAHPSKWTDLVCLLCAEVFYAKQFITHIRSKEHIHQFVHKYYPERVPGLIGGTLVITAKTQAIIIEELTLRVPQPFYREQIRCYNVLSKADVASAMDCKKRIDSGRGLLTDAFSLESLPDLSSMPPTVKFDDPTDGGNETAPTTTSVASSHTVSSTTVSMADRKELRRLMDVTLPVFPKVLPPVIEMLKQMPRDDAIVLAKSLMKKMIPPDSHPVEWPLQATVLGSDEPTWLSPSPAGPVTKSIIETESIADLESDLVEEMKRSAVVKIPDGEEAYIASTLEAATEPLIGLQHVYEALCVDPGYEPMYFCILCKHSLSVCQVISHVSSRTHILAYIELHYKRMGYSPLYETFRLDYASASNKNECLTRYATIIAGLSLQRITSRLVLKLDKSLVSKKEILQSPSDAGTDSARLSGSSKTRRERQSRWNSAIEFDYPEADDKEIKTRAPPSGSLFAHSEYFDAAPIGVYQTLMMKDEEQNTPEESSSENLLSKGVTEKPKQKKFMMTEFTPANQPAVTQFSSANTSSPFPLGKTLVPPTGPPGMVPSGIVPPISTVPTFPFPGFLNIPPPNLSFNPPPMPHAPPPFPFDHNTYYPPPPVPPRLSLPVQFPQMIPPRVHSQPSDNISPSYPFGRFSSLAESNSLAAESDPVRPWTQMEINSAGLGSMTHPSQMDDTKYAPVDISLDSRRSSSRRQDRSRSPKLKMEKKRSPHDHHKRHRHSRRKHSRRSSNRRRDRSRSASRSRSPHKPGRDERDQLSYPRHSPSSDSSNDPEPGFSDRASLSGAAAISRGLQSSITGIKGFPSEQHTSAKDYRVLESEDSRLSDLLNCLSKFSEAAGSKSAGHQPAEPKATDSDPSAAYFAGKSGAVESHMGTTGGKRASDTPTCIIEGDDLWNEVYASSPRHSPKRRKRNPVESHSSTQRYHKSQHDDADISRLIPCQDPAEALKQEGQSSCSVDRLDAILAKATALGTGGAHSAEIAKLLKEEKERSRRDDKEQKRLMELLTTLVVGPAQTGSIPSAGVDTSTRSNYYQSGNTAPKTSSSWKQDVRADYSYADYDYGGPEDDAVGTSRMSALGSYQARRPSDRAGFHKGPHIPPHFHEDSLRDARAALHNLATDGSTYSFGRNRGAGPLESAARDRLAPTSQMARPPTAVKKLVAPGREGVISSFHQARQMITRDKDWMPGAGPML